MTIPQLSGAWILPSVKVRSKCELGTVLMMEELLGKMCWPHDGLQCQISVKEELPREMKMRDWNEENSVIVVLPH